MTVIRLYFLYLILLAFFFFKFQSCTRNDFEKLKVLQTGFANDTMGAGPQRMDVIPKKYVIDINHYPQYWRNEKREFIVMDDTVDISATIKNTKSDDNFIVGFTFVKFILAYQRDSSSFEVIDSSFEYHARRESSWNVAESIFDNAESKKFIIDSN